MMGKGNYLDLGDSSGWTAFENPTKCSCAGGRSGSDGVGVVAIIEF
jgi:hypothetical protein